MSATPMVAEDPVLAKFRQVIPAELHSLFDELVALTDQCCHELLDDEYQNHCRELVAEVCQEDCPARSGPLESWASAIVCTASWVYSINDVRCQPHVQEEQIAEWFGVSTQTMQSKSELIRNALGLVQLGPDVPLASYQNYAVLHARVKMP